MDRTSNFSPNQDPFRQVCCDVQVFGDTGEDVFVVMNHALEFVSIPLVRLACQAYDCLLNHKEHKLAKVPAQMGDVAQQVTHAFEQVVPNANNDRLCDPLSWRKSIGILTPPPRFSQAK